MDWAALSRRPPCRIGLAAAVGLKGDGRRDVSALAV